MSSYDPSPPPLGTPGYRGGPEVSLSGLTEPQAREFHRLFILAFAVFTLIAVLAHVAAWAWRPWGHQTDPSQARHPVAAVSTLSPGAAAPKLG